MDWEVAVGRKAGSLRGRYTYRYKSRFPGYNLSYVLAAVSTASVLHH